MNFDMYLKIDENFITGINDIDIQHKFLFEAINNLADFHKNRGNLWSVMCNIQEYASVHFSTEENYMQKYNYPEIEEHIKEHKLFSEKYLVLKKELLEKGMTDEFLEKLRSFLAGWIVAHYTDIDIKMADFIKNAADNK